ncbi:MAG: hypothetical protein HN696_07355 [Euryarchaeota archaeon]|jgi:hypothetical protein|nr:hypothetical protein [Euryarchaeota archaeon]
MGDMVNLVVAYTVMIGLLAAWSWMLGKRLLELLSRLEVIEGDEDE